MEDQIKICDDCKATFDVEIDDGHVGDDGFYCYSCWTEYEKQSALDAGIPLSVIEGKTKLSDHYSKEYLDIIFGKSERDKDADKEEEDDSQR